MEELITNWKVLAVIIAGILSALAIIGIFNLQFHWEKGSGVKVKSGGIDKEIQLCWFISKHFSRYRNYTIWSWWKEIEAIIINDIKRSMFAIDTNFRMIVILQAKLNVYDYWRKFSHTIMENHFSHNEAELDRQVNNIIKDIVINILEPIQSDYCNVDLEFSKECVSEKIKSIIHRNRIEKEVLAEEFFKELDYKPTTEEITNVFRILA